MNTLVHMLPATVASLTMESLMCLYKKLSEYLRGVGEMQHDMTVRCNPFVIVKCRDVNDSIGNQDLLNDKMNIMTARSGSCLWIAYVMFI